MDNDYDEYEHDLNCFDEGMRGNCGEDCSVLLRGECDIEDEMLEILDVACVDDIGVETITEKPFNDFDRAMEILK